MPHASQYPLWGINRAFVALEAMELARRADRGEMPRSRYAQPPHSHPTSRASRTPMRRIALALVVAVVGVAAAGWVA